MTAAAVASAQGPVARALAACAGLFATRRRAIAFFAAYAVFHAVLRVLVPEALSRDELVDAAFAQGWSWGYHPEQPPLYTWLVVAATGALGPGMIAYAVVRYALLFLFYLFFYLAALRILREERHAGLAAASFLLVHLFAYDMLGNNYTQTLAVATSAAAMLYFFARIAEEDALVPYLGFGLAVGFGLLSKYSFPAFPATLLIAAAAIPSLRARVLDRRMLAAAGLAVVIVLPHALWILFGSADLRQGYQSHMQLASRPPYWEGVWAGTAGAANALFNLFSPLWLALVLAFPAAFRPRSRSEAAPEDLERLLARWLAVMATIVVAGVLFFGVQRFKNHHLLMLLLPVPIYVFQRLRARPPSALRLQAFAGLACLATVLVAAILIGRPFAGPKLCARCDLSAAYGRIADDMKAAGFAGGTIVADGVHVAGNLRRWFPDSAVYMAQWPRFAPPSATGRQCLAVWRAGPTGDAVPGDLARFLTQRFGIAAADFPPPAFSATPRYRADGPVQRLGYLLFPAGAGSCGRPA